MILTLSGCTTTRTHTYNTGQRLTICDNKNIDLGNTVVLYETAWRSDQKEPLHRQQMALEEIENVFMQFPCGNIDLSNGIVNFNSLNITEIEMLKKYSRQMIDTVIIIRLEELTPRLEITFSIPFLWSGFNEADFRVKAISVKSANTFIDMRVKRVTGGPFNIRPAEWSRTEFNAALSSIIKKDD